MTANKIYKLPPVDTSRDPYRLRKHVHEVDFDNLKKGDMERVEVRYYAAHDYDGRRVWVMFSVWLDGKPFMICQEAGREGDDYKDRLITDAALYAEAVLYLHSLYEYPEDDPTARDVIDPDEDVPGLEAFYDNSLWDFYDPDLKPKYKAGDVLMVRVPVDHLRDRKNKVVTRVKVGRVNPMNPRETYWGMQKDRRWGDPRKGEPGNVMVEDPGKGGVGATFTDADVVGYATGGA
jgi:hypothetical protein